MATVLIAEDAAHVRRLCAMVLTQGGYEVLQAETGREALRLYQAHRPDLVLLDIDMPELDGLATLREIKRLDPEAAVAMVTGLRGQASVREAIEAGARSYIVKPFRPDDLLQRVRRLLSNGTRALGSADPERQVPEQTWALYQDRSSEKAWRLLEDARHAAGLSHAELAQRSGLLESTIRRMEEPGCPYTLESLAQYVEALGAEFSLEVSVRLTTMASPPRPAPEPVPPVGTES